MGPDGVLSPAGERKRACMYIQKTKGPDEGHPRALRELADILSKPLYDISKVMASR